MTDKSVQLHAVTQNNSVKCIIVRFYNSADSKKNTENNIEVDSCIIPDEVTEKNLTLRGVKIPKLDYIRQNKQNKISEDHSTTNQELKLIYNIPVNYSLLAS